MNATHGWRFVDADDLTDDLVNFGNLPVRSSTRSAEELGTLEGFIVDPARGRLHFVVVESGGWFSGGTYLLPPSYTQLDAEQQVMWVDATRDAVQRFPEFDPDQYREDISDRELWAIERRIIETYGDDPGVVAPTPEWDRDAWPHYAQPTWWKRDYLGRRDPATDTPIVATDAPVGIRIREDASGNGSVRLAPGVAVDPDTARAQPGDVLGLARGGETTSLGDTAEDEDERRRNAEREGEPLAEDALRRDAHRETRRRGR